jgi:hypothetical protein
MELTFSEQRTTLNAVDPQTKIKQIQTEWPFLFRPIYAYQYFHEVMNFEIKIFENHLKFTAISKKKLPKNSKKKNCGAY